MFPNILDIGFLHLHTYGACMAIGFLAVMLLLEKAFHRKDVSGLLVWMLLTGIIGARIAYVIEHWHAEFAAEPLRVLRVDQGGLMFYGGLILALVVFFTWCRLHGQSALKLADLVTTVLPLGHAFGRVGCFFYGCCYGRVSSSALAVRFPVHSPAWYEQTRGGLIPPDAVSSLPVLPTQLFEAAALFALFAGLLFVRRRYGNRPGVGTGAYMVAYASIRFGMEFLRGDPRVAFWGLSIGQVISIGLALLGAAFLVWGGRRPCKAAPEESR